MLLNLTEVFKEQGKVVRETVPVEIEHFRLNGTEYPLMQKTDAEWVLTNLEPGRARIEGNVKLIFQAPCDRCLCDVSVQLELKPERYVVPPERATEEDEEIDDLSFMEGYQLNTETLLYNEILENWPAKILCKDDCKGLCPVCGKNRNDGDCGCDTFVPDPRMAAIKDVFNACKEV
ncbi:MAG: DUF177 domain-containing protein [Lachnospiraceae bacterium]|nr:DUF177 domain-containing protein [Lachnospiraceae bacterium]